MTEKTRIIGIEIFRIAAAFAVICIHIPPFAETDWIPHYKTLFYGISHLCRFAVPYFFLTSGYWYGKNLEETPAPGPAVYKRLKRFFFLFFAWSLIYLMLPDSDSLKQAAVNGLSLEQLPSIFPVMQRMYLKFQIMPLNFLMEGNTGHLWFFTALMSAYIVLYALRFDKAGKLLLLTAVGFYLFGLLNSHYSATPIGIHLPVTFYFRNGPFCSTLFVAVGFWISKLKKIPAMPAAVSLACFGFLTQELEAFLLWFYYDTGPNFDYLAGTVPFASGLFLAALNIRKAGAHSFLLGLSRLTLGIYLCHLIAEKAVRFFFTVPDSALWQIALPALVFCVSAVGTYLLKKIPFTKILVT